MLWKRKFTLLPGQRGKVEVGHLLMSPQSSLRERQMGYIVRPKRVFRTGDDGS